MSFVRPSRPFARFSWRRTADDALFYICLIGLLVVFVFPLAWMIITSLKTSVQAVAYPPLWLFRPTLQNYVDVFANNPFFLYMMNSTLIAVCAVGVSLLAGLPAAYAIARYKLKKLGLLILLVKFLPGIVFLVPLFVVYRQFGMINTLWGVALSHIIIILPLVIWIAIGFFEDIPRELEEAAIIDGSTRMGIFLRIVLPLSKPGIVAATILGFIASWNNFIFVLILGGTNTVTLPMAVYSFVSFEDVNWGGLTAAATVITVPILALSLIVQRHLAGGLTIGAVKG
jgi:multiple sugar transport system permease protein